MSITLTGMEVSVEQMAERLRKQAYEQSLHSLKYWKRNAEEVIANTLSNRRAAKLLNEAGIVPESYNSWNNGSQLVIRLGFFKRTKADRKRLTLALAAVRNALRCSMKFQGKTEKDVKAGTIEVAMGPVNFPGLTVYFTEKVKSGMKCRWVTEKVRKLVCEVQ